MTSYRKKYRPYDQAYDQINKLHALINVRVRAVAYSQVRHTAHMRTRLHDVKLVIDEVDDRLRKEI